MTRDETVALFLECEAKRGCGARGGAGRGQRRRRARMPPRTRPQRRIGTPGRRHGSPSERRWKRTGAGPRRRTSSELEPSNPETRAWMEAAEANFSRCLFLVRGAEGTKETAGEEKKESEDGDPPVKSIQLEADRADFSGFIFPGDASFESATFSGDASVRKRHLHRRRPVRTRHLLRRRLGSNAPPSPATPRSKRRLLRRRLVRKRHLLRRRLVRKRHLLRRRLVRKRHLLRRRLVRKRHLHRRRLVRMRHLHGRRLVRKRHLLRRRPVRKRHLLAATPVSKAPPSRGPRLFLETPPSPARAEFRERHLPKINKHWRCEIPRRGKLHGH